jgi:hypothetical protein
MKRLQYEHTPAWVPAPPEAAQYQRYKYTYIVIDHPDGGWTVATSAEVEALIDSESFLGKMLIGHAAQLALPDLSNN